MQITVGFGLAAAGIAIRVIGSAKPNIGSGREHRGRSSRQGKVRERYDGANIGGSEAAC